MAGTTTADVAAEQYEPAGPTLEELAQRAKLEALVSIVRGEDVDDNLHLPEPDRDE